MSDIDTALERLIAGLREDWPHIVESLPGPASSDDIDRLGEETRRRGYEVPDDVLRLYQRHDGLGRDLVFEGIATVGTVSEAVTQKNRNQAQIAEIAGIAWEPDCWIDMFGAGFGGFFGFVDVATGSVWEACTFEAPRLVAPSLAQHFDAHALFLETVQVEPRTRSPWSGSAGDRLFSFLYSEMPNPYEPWPQLSDMPDETWPQHWLDDLARQSERQTR